MNGERFYRWSRQDGLRDWMMGGPCVEETRKRPGFWSDPPEAWRMRPVLGRGMPRASDALSRDVGSSGPRLSVGSVPERSRQMGPP